MLYLYAGESNGGRIVRFGGHATSQIKTSGTESVLMDAETWDLVPMGPAGDVLFRQIIVTFKASNGYHIRVTPTVDGVALGAQDFSGAGSGVFVAQPWIAERGARISVRVQQVTRAGDFELLAIEVVHAPLRAHP